MIKQSRSTAEENERERSLLAKQRGLPEFAVAYVLLCCGLGMGEQKAQEITGQERKKKLSCTWGDNVLTCIFLL